mgnify:CR=1 FL=1
MRKKRENGMAKESGMGDFPRKQFESVLLHSLRIMDQNREYPVSYTHLTLPTT